MKLFSDELSWPAQKANLLLGFRVLFDEWFWIIVKLYHKTQKISLERKLERCIYEDEKKSIRQKLVDLDNMYSEFRKVQIANRI